jgi:hypothetical protein
MRIKNILLWLLTCAALSVSANAQTVTLEGSSSGGFSYDHATLFEAGAHSGVQLTDNSESYTHYLSFVGIRDGELIRVTQVGHDGLSFDVTGSCSLNLPSQITCTVGRNQIVFTVKGDSK